MTHVLVHEEYAPSPKVLATCASYVMPMVRGVLNMNANTWALHIPRNFRILFQSFFWNIGWHWWHTCRGWCIRVGNDACTFRACDTPVNYSFNCDHLQSLLQLEWLDYPVCTRTRWAILWNLISVVVWNKCLVRWMHSLWQRCCTFRYPSKFVISQ